MPEDGPTLSVGAGLRRPAWAPQLRRSIGASVACRGGCARRLACSPCPVAAGRCAHEVSSMKRYKFGLAMILVVTTVVVDLHQHKS